MQSYYVENRPVEKRNKKIQLLPYDASLCFVLLFWTAEFCNFSSPNVSFLQAYYNSIQLEAKNRD